MPDIDTRADGLRLRSVAVTSDLALMPVIGALPGTAIVGAGYANGAGKGGLKSEGDGKTLRWKAPGGTYGGPVRVESDGIYLLEDQDNSKWVRVKVFTAFLSPTPLETAVYLQDRFGLLLGDVYAAEAQSGIEQSTNLGLKNVSRTTMSNLKAWIDPETSTELQIALSLDGLNWVSPQTEAAALLIGSVGIGETKIISVQRTIAAGSAAKPRLTNHLRFSWSGK